MGLMEHILHSSNFKLRGQHRRGKQNKILKLVQTRMNVQLQEKEKKSFFQILKFNSVSIWTP
jgi:hypothetical protein